MKTISLKLPAALDMKLTALIRRQGGSKSAIIQSALEAYLDREGEAAQGSVLEAAQDLCGCLEGPADLSTSHCEAMISEAYFLLRALPGGPNPVLELLYRALIQTPFRLSDEIAPIQRLLSRYVNVPMSMADACLVRMAETYPRSTVFTCDSDFKIYRKNRRQLIPVMMPND